MMQCQPLVKKKHHNAKCTAVLYQSFLTNQRIAKKVHVRRQKKEDMHHLMMLRTQLLAGRSFDATRHSDTRALLKARKATPRILWLWKLTLGAETEMGKLKLGCSLPK